MPEELSCENFNRKMTQYPKYKVTNSQELDVIEFISVGKNGNIRKAIHIQATHNPIVFNLGFGDMVKRIKNGEIVFELDDSVNSENGDRDKVLATVAGAAYNYTAKYPERWVIFEGIDAIRTRLYRMAITKNYAELSKDFFIFGVIFENGDPVLHKFDSNTRFDGFIVKRK